MNHSRVVFLVVSLALFLIEGGGAEPKEKPAPSTPATLTFFLTGVECPACVYAVNDSIRQVDGVEEIIEGQDSDFFSKVTFDPSRASAHRIAQAVREAFPLHGEPYQAWLRLRIPDYARGDNTAKVDALLKRWKDRIRAEITDRNEGEITLHFLLLPESEDQASSAPEKALDGWRHDQFFEALTRPAPDGLGLRLEWVTPG